MKYFVQIILLLVSLLSSSYTLSATEIYFKAEQGMLPDRENNYEVTYSSENYEIVKKIPYENNIDLSDLVLTIYALDEESPVYAVNKFILSGPGGKFSGPGHYELVRHISRTEHYAGFDTVAGCNTGKGEVDVYEVEHDSNDVITSLAADLYYRCGQQYNRTFVKIRFNSNIPLHLPIAHASAGEDIKAQISETVMLNGSQSYTDNQEIVSYRWSQIGGEPISIEGSDSANASITIPEDRETFDIYEFKLEVMDNKGKQSEDNVAVTIGERKPVFRRTLYRQGAHYRWQETLEDYTLSLDDLYIKKTGHRGMEFRNTEDGGYDLFLVLEGKNYDNFENIGLGAQPFTVNRFDLGANLPLMYHFGWCGNFSQPSRKSMFNILDLEYGENLQVKRLAVDYLDYCDDSYRLKLIGKIRYDSFTPLIADHPYALAGPDRTIISYDKAFLIGMFSYSDGSFIKSFHWTQVAGPSLILEDENSPVARVSPNLIITDEVEAEFELTVIDANNKSSKDRVKVKFPALQSKKSHVSFANFNNYLQQQTYTHYGINGESIDLKLINSPSHALEISMTNFERSHIRISAGTGNELVEGEFQNVISHFDNNLMSFVSTSNSVTCGWEEQSTDLSIKQLHRDENGLIDELAFDYISYCNYSILPTKGSVRVNSDTPFELDIIDVDTGADFEVYEGEQINLNAIVEHDKTVYAEWRVAHGPKLLFKTGLSGPSPYALSQSIVAPTVPKDESRNMVFHLRVWDEDGALGEDYVAVKIKDKESELDFVEATNLIDKPFVVNVEGFQKIGIRNSSQRGSFSRLQYSTELLDEAQLTPIINAVSEGVHHSSELFIKTENVEGLRLLAFTDSKTSKFVENYNFRAVDLDNGWSKVEIHLPTPDYDLNTNDRWVAVKFVLVGNSVEGGDTGSGDTGSGDTGSGDTGSGDTGSGDTGSGDTGGGGSIPLNLILVLFGACFLRIINRKVG